MAFDDSERPAATSTVNGTVRWSTLRSRPISIAAASVGLVVLVAGLWVLVLASEVLSGLAIIVAAVCILLAAANELLRPEELNSRFQPPILHPQFDPLAEAAPVAREAAGSAGAATVGTPGFPWPPFLTGTGSLYYEASPSSARDRMRERIVAGASFAVIFGIAVFMRLHELGSWPPIHVDEGIAGVDAIKLFSLNLLEPSLKHYLPVSLLPLRLSFEVFGVSLTVMRLVSVLYGLGVVAATYWAGHVLFGRNAGLLAAAFMASSHMAIALSRFGGAANSQSIFLAVLCLAVYAQALKSGRWWWPAWGVVVGLGLYSYEGFRIVPFAIVIALLMSPVLVWKLRRDLAMAAGAALIIASPLVLNSLSEPGRYLLESESVSVLGDKQVFFDQYETDSVLVVLREQFEKSIKYFFEGKNRDTQYPFRGPGFDWLSRVLFVAGVVVAAAKIRDLRYRTVLLWFGLGVFIGSALTETPPLVPRLTMVLPAAALLIAAPIALLLDRLPAPRARPAFGLLSVAFVVFLFFPNYNNYFRDYTEADIFWPWIEPNRAIGDYVGGLDGVDQVYLLRTPGVFDTHGAFEFTLATYDSPPSVIQVNRAGDDGWELGTVEFPEGPAYLVGPAEALETLTALRDACPAASMATRDGPMGNRGEIGLQYVALVAPDSGCIEEALE